MLSSLISNALTSMLISILIDAAIFNIMYSTINSGVRYLRTVIIYTLCMEVRLILMTGIASFSIFLVSFGIYFVIGLILMWILSKIAQFFERTSFIVISIVLQNVVAWLLSILV